MLIVPLAFKGLKVAPDDTVALDVISPLKPPNGFGAVALDVTSPLKPPNGFGAVELDVTSPPNPPNGFSAVDPLDMLVAPKFSGFSDVGLSKKDS